MLRCALIVAAVPAALGQTEAQLVQELKALKEALSDQQQIIEAQRMKMDAFEGRRLQTAMNSTEFETVPWHSLAA